MPGAALYGAAVPRLGKMNNRISIRLLCASAVATFFLFGCEPSAKVRVIPPFDISGRPHARDLVTRVPLPREYEAVLAHGHFTDERSNGIDFVEVAIERELPDGSIEVLISKAYPVDDLPENFLEKEAKDIVKFDSANEIVSIETGIGTVFAQLPR